ncbi:RNA polymerase sigma-70 factor [Flavobacterium aquicola]|uniref:RNA polymerase sigma-70 factor (ECF subfamily) n=1 Tax=Flavobacterium aquicola TaxID=1682742 RepID=A0A3E0EL10_9FLAO|nr:RNA polymerase sigma-70 factor [Flavobacterium aquicola]REG98413.1 RNA polymerase sigma-70 factor (ECF subfamily) [Flavobacterium aquicola]
MKKKHDFESLYRNFWKKLYVICYNKTANREAAEEMVQDIFISLWNRRNELVITSSIEHYLIKSAKLKVIDYYRMQSSVKQNNLMECNLCEHPEFDEKYLQHNEAVYKFLEQDIEVVINDLPCQCQKVYRLSREEQLSTAEIADNLNISPKTVKNHLTKALRSIRENIPLLFLITALQNVIIKIFL